jgi:hypothetical protein
MVQANRFTIVALAGIAALAGGVYAGEDMQHGLLPEVHKRSYFTAGGTRLDMNETNRSLAAAGYHRIRDYAVQLGGGINWRVRRIMSGLELFGYIWQKEELATTYTNLGGIGSRLNIGVNVLPEGAFLLYPQFSFGLGGLRLKLGNHEAAFSDAVAAPMNNVSLWQRSFVLAPGIGFDYRLKKRSHGNKFMVAGIRAGYAFDVSDRDDWRSDWVDITDGPRLRASGPFLRIVIGTSHVRKGKRCCDKEA